MNPDKLFGGAIFFLNIYWFTSQPRCSLKSLSLLENRNDHENRPRHGKDVGHLKIGTLYNHIIHNFGTNRQNAAYEGSFWGSFSCPIQW